MSVIRVLSLGGDGNALPLEGDNNIPWGRGGMYHGPVHMHSRQKTFQDQGRGNGMAGTLGPAIQARVRGLALLPYSTPALVGAPLGR